MASRKAVSDVLDEMAGVYRIPALATSVKATYCEDLADLSDDDLRAAARAHRRDVNRGSFFPKPADFLAGLAASRPKHPDPDAAWALVVPSMDEARTVVLTDLMLAARAKVSELFCSGDRIGAALAFKGFYRMLLDGSRGQEPPRWVVSAGFDREERDRVTMEAVNSGLLSAAAAAPRLSHVQARDVGSVVGVPLLEDQRGSGMQRLLEAMRSALGTRRGRDREKDTDQHQALAEDPRLQHAMLQLRMWGGALPSDQVPGADEALGLSILNEGCG